jgi:hypothetical protein
VTTMESPAEVNEDFNLSTAQSSPVTELAQAIWLNLKRGLPLPRFTMRLSTRHQAARAGC